MINTLKLIFVSFIISLCFTSCEKEEVIETNELGVNELDLRERRDNINKLNESIIEYSNFSKREKKNSKKGTLNSKSYQREEQELVNSVVKNSKIIFDDLGVEESELKLISSQNSDTADTDDVYVAFGLALASSHNFQSSDVNNGGSLTVNGGSIGGCLMEATGVNSLIALGDAAYTLYGGEVAAGHAVDSAAAAKFRRAALKAATKIIKRAAGGFGAIVMIADFTRCMAS